jgi:hypothetical protein
MSSLKVVKLGNDGTEYVMGSLETGRLLSSGIREHIGALAGNAVAVVPAHLSLEQLLDFRRGGKVSGTEGQTSGGRLLLRTEQWQPIYSLDEPLVDFVVAFLEGECNLCAVEHPIALPADPWLRKHVGPSELLCASDGVYFIAFSGPGKREATVDCFDVTRSSWPPTIGLLFRGVSRTHLRRTLHAVEKCEANSRRKLAQLLDRLAVVVVGAWDGEGHVLWFRDSEAELLDWLRQKHSAQGDGTAPTCPA